MPGKMKAIKKVLKQEKKLIKAQKAYKPMAPKKRGRYAGKALPKP